MGLLDKMLSSVVKNATGVDARRLIRKVGAGKILLAGGAALAGAALAGKMNQGSGQGGGQWAGFDAPPRTRGAAPPPPPGAAAPAAGAAPPLPPLPGTAASPVPPPPPPLPTPGTPAEAAPEPAPDDLPKGLLYAVVRTMVAAALADGELGEEERELIQGQLEGGELSPEQAAQVRKDLVLPPGPSELARMVEGMEEAAPGDAVKALYRAALLVTRSNREVSALEEGFLTRLATALALGPEERQALRDDLAALLPPAP